MYEGEKHFDLTVRWLEPYRNSIESIREITVSTPDGSNVPLGQLASVTPEEGPSVIYREDAMRYSPVKFSVRGRDLQSTIADAKQQIDAQVHRPYDTHLEWGGEINELNEAMGRLVLIIPLTLIAIGFLEYTAVKNWVDTVIVIVSIPVACTGGVLALLVTHINLSVSAAMSFISIFGIAIQDAILVVTYFQRLREVEGHTVRQAAREAVVKRFRAGLMTTLVATLGLTPAALSTGIGADAKAACHRRHRRVAHSRHSHARPPTAATSARARVDGAKEGGRQRCRAGARGRRASFPGVKRAPHLRAMNPTSRRFRRSRQTRRARS